MYLSALKIHNFRQFGADQDSLVIEFNKGVTALVGENDAGKSSVIDALRLVLQTRTANTFACSRRIFSSLATGIRPIRSSLLRSFQISLRLIRGLSQSM